MAKLSLTDLVNLTNDATVVSTINANSTAIETALEKTLSRDGTSPNSMEADLDMNSNQILNLPDATTDQEPATYGQMLDAIEALENGAVINASFVVLGTHADITNERVLTPGNHLTMTDGGAGGNVTLDVDEASLNADTATLTNKSIDLADNTLTGTLAEFNTALSDANFASLTGTETLTGKTIDLTDNTVTGTLAEFNTAVSDADLASLAGTETLTNKTVALGSNTISGTTAQFNTALTDNNFATQAGSETLTNKTIALGSNTVSGTLAEFNTAVTDANLASLAGAETLTNKTVNLTSNTLTGTTAQFNTSLSDGDFATLAGTETLTNKTINTDNNTVTGTSASATTFLRGDNTWATPAGAGDVVGPASATDNAVARYDGTTGELIQNSAVIIDDSNNVTGVVALTATGAISGATVAGNMVATQAQQETGTATNVVVTPGRQHYHPGMAKAWGNISSGAVVTSGYNVASASLFATGIYDVDLTNSMSSTAYTVLVTPNSNLIGSVAVVDVNTIRFNFRTGAGADTNTNFFFVVYGDM